MRRLAYLLIVATVQMSFIASAGAESSKLKQQILPINCIFEIVDYGTGEIRFLTPEECGVVVTPDPQPESENSQSRNSGNGSTIFSQSGVFTIQNLGLYNDQDLPLKAINLDRYASFRTSLGQDILVRAGQTYYFRTTASNNAKKLTSVFISKITKNSIVISINGKSERELLLRHTLALDINQDNIVDFFIGAKSIKSSSIAVVNFRYFQTVNNRTPDNTTAKDDYTAVYVLAGIILIITAERISRWRRKELVDKK